MSLTDARPPESLVRANTPPANAMARVWATETHAAEPAASHMGVLAIACVLGRVSGGSAPLLKFACWRRTASVVGRRPHPHQVTVIPSLSHPVLYRARTQLRYIGIPSVHRSRPSLRSTTPSVATGRRRAGRPRRRRARDIACTRYSTVRNRRGRARDPRARVLLGSETECLQQLKECVPGMNSSLCARRAPARVRVSPAPRGTYDTRYAALLPRAYRASRSACSRCRWRGSSTYSST
eukprot:COSAG02_NODE_3333_length_6915_cov_4.111649_3_plen_238_part_00